MAILFTHNRLHVGYRRCNWFKVWYEYIGEPGEDGEPDIGLYSRTKGEAQSREPMEDEVMWNPEFDPANCDAKTAKGRRKLQCRFLYDAWRYLAEKDQQKVLELEDKLDEPGFPKWHEWFKEAKKYKRVKTRQRKGKRQERSDIAKAAGCSAGEADVNSDTTDDSDDSAYGSARGGRSRTPMGPPVRKRKTPRSQIPFRTPYTPRTNDNGRFAGRGTLSDYSISGVRGSSIIDDRNADSDDDASVMDTRNPFSTQGSAKDRAEPENGDEVNKSEHGNEE